MAYDEIGEEPGLLHRAGRIENLPSPNFAISAATCSLSIRARGATEQHAMWQDDRTWAPSPGSSCDREGLQLKPQDGILGAREFDAATRAGIDVDAERRLVFQIATDDEQDRLRAL